MALRGIFPRGRLSCRFFLRIVAAATARQPNDDLVRARVDPRRDGGGMSDATLPAYALGRLRQRVPSWYVPCPYPALCPGTSRCSHSGIASLAGCCISMQSAMA
jgi:hypothetical protein